MSLKWVKDDRNNRVAFTTLEGRKVTARVFSNGFYGAVSVIGKSISGRISTITLFSGKAASINEGMRECENKLEDLTSLKVPVIKVENNICTIEVPRKSEVKYTTNGKDVKKTNKVYKEPFEVENSIIKAVAYFEDGTVSEQVEYQE